MRNMNYFCSVKRFRLFLTLISTCIISLFTNEIQATNKVDSLYYNTDSVEISLLTCSSGDEVYSLYGHTAIRYKNSKENIDLAINYGIFSFKKPFFILRFIFGLTDYEMGITPFNYFCEEYKNSGRYVFQQVLNLTPQEKAEIISAIKKNYQIENRTYRYNYFYDNCTTRARDILTRHINGNLYYTDKQDNYPSFRELIHSFNNDYPWARFGNDMLLGLKADKKTDLNEYQFLPINLMKGFETAKIKDENGHIRPLVKQSSYIVQGNYQAGKKSFPLRPITCAWILFIITILITLLEFELKKNLWIFDTFLMIIDGCIGLILFIMLFSKHPATSTNLQIFLFNPLPLFFTYHVAQDSRNKKRNNFWLYASVAIFLFFMGGFLQEYAEGTYILALSLLVRCIWNIIRQK